MKLCTLFRTERPKTIPYPAARPRIGHIKKFYGIACIHYNYKCFNFNKEVVKLDELFSFIHQICNCWL